MYIETQVDPEIVEISTDAAHWFRSIGCEVTDDKCPDLSGSAEMFLPLRGASFLRQHGLPLSRELLSVTAAISLIVYLISLVHIMAAGVTALVAGTYEFSESFLPSSANGTRTVVMRVLCVHVVSLLLPRAYTHRE